MFGIKLLSYQGYFVTIAVYPILMQAVHEVLHNRIVIFWNIIERFSMRDLHFILTHQQSILL